MGERINNWQEWAGSAIVALAITGYLINQYFATAGAEAAPDAAPLQTADSDLTDPLLLAEQNEITVSGGGRPGTISSAVPVLARVRSVNEAAIAATPGSLPSFSFKHTRSLSMRR
jgi:hypothetical protein